MTDALLRAALGGGVAVVLIWVTVRTLRLSPRLQTALWWAVSLKFLVMMAWTTPLEVGVLPAIVDVRNTGQQVQTAAFGPTARPLESDALASPRPAVPGPPSGGLQAIDWRSIVLGGWLLGVVASIGHGYRQGRRTSAIWRSARPAPSAITTMAHDLALTLGVGSAPPVFISDQTATPLVMGPWRPVIILPASFVLGGPVASLRLAVAHELIHVRRHDLKLAWVPAVAEHLFFFHPLARLAVREYALSREAACDAAVVDELGVAPHDYGKLLLDLGVGRPGAALVAAGAPWSAAHLRRRLIMLEFPWIRSRRSQVVAGIALALGVLALIPAHLVARRPQPTSTTVLFPPADAVSRALDQVEVTPEGGFTFVLFLDQKETVSNAGALDLARARRSRQGDESLLWFRLGSREYVVRDPSALAALTRAWSAQGRQEIELLAKDAADEVVALQKGELADFHAGLQEEHARLQADNEARHAEELMKAARRHAELQDLDKVLRLREYERRAAQAATPDRDREQVLRRGLAELREKIAELEAELAQLQDQPTEATTVSEIEQRLLERELEDRAKAMRADQRASERALFETRRLLEEIVATGRAQRVP